MKKEMKTEQAALNTLFEHINTILDLEGKPKATTKNTKKVKGNV